MWKVKQNFDITNFLLLIKNQHFYVDIINDCDPNEGGFYCRIYDDNRIIIKDGMPIDVEVIDFGNYLDDMCIHLGDCEFNSAGISTYLYDYILNNILAY